MPTRTRPTRRPARTAGTVLKGLLALVAIVVLLVGIPVALVAVGASPIPDSFPSWNDILTSLTEPDDGSLFLATLALIAWLGWAGFAVGLLVEIPAAVRGRPAVRLPVIRVQQRAAAGLVAAAAALLTVGPAGVATAAEAPVARATSEMIMAAPGPAEVTASDVATTNDTQAQPSTADSTVAQATTPQAKPEKSQAQAPQPRTHVVQYGESLWRIAEDELGDGARWREIAELNYGTPQPDGGALDRSHWIAPGWRLVLPSAPDQSPPAADAAAPDTGEQQQSLHIVQKGDTLWDIAEERLGDGLRYPELFEASRHTVQPDGRRMTDPDLIYPGWHVTIPVAGPPKADPPEEKEPPEKEPKPPVEEPPVDEEPPVEPPVEEPPVDEEPSVDEEPPSEDNQIDVPADQGEDDAAEGFPVRTAAGIGSLLAAGVLGYVAMRRRAQQRRRAPGERIAMPAGAVAETEQELRGVADPMSVETVDLALRGLAQSCAQRGVALPPLRIARLTGEQFELYFTDNAELPAPFVATEQGHVWFLPADASSDADPAELRGIPAPYPSLVTIGHGPEEGHLLLDLERLGTLALVGEPHQWREAMAALAVELATSPWADDLQVTLVGICPELASGLETGRIRYLPSVGTLLDDLARRAESDRSAMAASGASSLDHARSSGVASATWTPEIVLLGGDGLSAEQRDQLFSLVTSLPRVAVAAVTSGDDVIGDWWLELSPSDPDVAVLQPVGVEVSPQRIDDHQYRQILELLGITSQPGSRVQAADEPEPETDEFEDVEVDLPYRADLPAQASVSADAHETSVPADGADANLGNLTDLTDLDAEFAELRGNEASQWISAQRSGLGESTPDPADAVGPVPPPPPPVPAQPSGPTILLLGSVEVENAEGPIEQSKYRQLTEIAAFIALHPGLDHEALDEAIWPGNRVTQNTRNTAISKLRRWFGSDADGEDYLPRVDSGYRFRSGVSTDWDQWQEWVGNDPRVASTDQLVAALELVRGQPFTGVSPRRYAWAEHLKQEMISTIVDAAHELAQRALTAGDAHLARKAATIGLQVEPGMELLWRDRIKAEHMAGSRAGIDDAVARLLAISEDLGDDLEDATVSLIEELAPSQGPHRPLSGAELSGRF